MILLSFIFVLLIPRHIGAHCITNGGNIDHSSVGCTPSISPAPTESPAPSPSPSETPTDTQAPSHSIAPSSSPTNAPTTSEPSANPTDSPTESPAPSPSPSMTPSDAPSKSLIPSASPSSSPSAFPSASPSDSPTASPSAFPSVFPSSSPTPSPIFLTATGVGITIEDVTGERKMNASNIEYFEEKIKIYLENHVYKYSEVFVIEVEEVLVTNQRLNMEGSNNTLLLVTIEVTASISLNSPETFDFEVFLEDFFEEPNHQKGLRAILENDMSFSGGMFIKKVEISSSKNASVPKASASNKIVTGAVLGTVALIVACGLIWMWIQTRHRILNFRSIRDRKLNNQSTDSKSYDSNDRSAAISYGDASGRILVTDSSSSSDDINQNNQSHPTELNDEETSISNSRLMYIPTLIATESNIEVPDTPVTAFAINGFRTPRNDNEMLLSTGEKSNQDELLAERKKKNLLPPSILWKSPFHRESKPKYKVDNDVENEFEASSSMFGAGVVAGENNVGFFGGRKKETKVKESNRASTIQSPPPPTEIGGPNPPPYAKSSIANDYGVVDIVDEIAYLYSTNNDPDNIGEVIHLDRSSNDGV